MCCAVAIKHVAGPDDLLLDVKFGPTRPGRLFKRQNSGMGQLHHTSTLRVCAAVVVENRAGPCDLLGDKISYLSQYTPVTEDAGGSYLLRRMILPHPVSMKKSTGDKLTLNSQKI